MQRGCARIRTSAPSNRLSLYVYKTTWNLLNFNILFNLPFDPQFVYIYIELFKYHEQLELFASVTVIIRRGNRDHLLANSNFDFKYLQFKGKEWTSGYYFSRWIQIWNTHTFIHNRLKGLYVWYTICLISQMKIKLWHNIFQVHQKGMLHLVGIRYVN